MKYLYMIFKLGEGLIKKIKNIWQIDTYKSVMT
jgi:hypothetical protein